MLDRASRVIAIVGSIALCATALFNIGYFSVVGFHFIGTVDLTNVIYTLALISTVIFVIVLMVFLIADVFETGRKGWEEKSKLLLLTVTITGSLALLGVYLTLRVGLLGLTTFWLSLMLSTPFIILANVFGAIGEWRKNKKVSTVKVGLAIVFSSIMVVFLGKIAAENQALNSKEKFELVTESEILADVRIVRSSSVGLIISKDGQIMFFPMGRIKSIKSNDRLDPIIYERSSP